jgi:hypothetical protein
MADNLGSFKVFAQGGLNLNRDVLSQGETQPGSAISLLNYEPATTGGYRRVSGYTNDYGTVPGDSSGSVLGVAVAAGINDGILAARKPSTGNNYLHYWDATAESWTAVTTSGSPTMTGVSKVRFTRFNWGTAKVILTDGVNPAATYDGTTYTQITATEAPDDPKFAAVFKNHMWLAGDPAEPHNVYFSAPTDETKWSPADGAGVINVGFPVVAIKPFRDSLFVFGTNNIKRIVGNNISDWAVQHVTDDLGCLASDSVIEIGGDLIFLSQDGIRPISGTDKIGDVNLETLTKNIQSFVSDVIFNNDLDAVSSVIIRGKSQFRLFYNTDSGAALLGGLRLGQQGGIGFEFGQMIGIEATCADSGYIDKEEYVIHGDTSGKVYRQESGNSFGGNNIVSLYQTPFLHMQDPEQRKIIHTVATYLRSEGDNEIIMSVIFDYDDTTILNPTNFILTNEGAAAYYNEAIYDEPSNTTIWSGNPSPVQRVNVSGSGKSVSFRYVTNDTNAAHSVQGIVVTFGVGDRL